MTTAHSSSRLAASLDSSASATSANTSLLVPLREQTPLAPHEGGGAQLCQAGWERNKKEKKKKENCFWPAGKEQEEERASGWKGTRGRRRRRRAAGWAIRGTETRGLASLSTTPSGNCKRKRRLPSA